ncbi:MAG: alpha/beta hydrolase [Acidimicrobiia bacterium]|nr:alpha/beta hydrolase [Acidimicrobiia bacterium]
MALDPAAQGFLDQMDEAGMPPLNEMTPAEAREAAMAFADLGGEGDPVADQSDRTIPGPAGEIPMRVYTPEGDGPFPALVYFHGGGWVLGDLDGVNAICRTVAARAECVVASVDYRLAPEHKYPAPLDDCFAAAQWVAEQGTELGVDTSRIAVGGDSAGGNLAAAVALRARESGGPELAMQLLVYPVTDLSFGTGSYDENGDGYLLTTDMMKWFWDLYLNDASEGESHLVSPLRADDLSGLPPAVVLTAEYDPLRDEGEAYADRLREAGVAVTHERFDSQIHAFWQMMAVFPAASEAADLAAAELRSAFAQR